METITVAASVVADNKLIVRHETLRFLPVLSPRTKKQPLRHKTRAVVMIFFNQKMMSRMTLRAASLPMVMKMLFQSMFFIFVSPFK